MRIILFLFSLALFALAFATNAGFGATSVVGWSLGFAFAYASFNTTYREQERRAERLSRQLRDLEERA